MTRPVGQLVYGWDPQAETAEQRDEMERRELADLPAPVVELPSGGDVETGAAA